MKQIKTITGLAAGAAIALALSTAVAQETSTTVTGGTTGVGVSTSTGTTGVSATTGTTGVGVSTSSSTGLDGTGTITTYSPDSDYLSLRTSTSADPVKYYYTPKTVFVDSEGHNVERSLLRSDMPVHYSYVKEGDRMVVSKVTLTKPVSYYEKTTTTTTTTKP